MPLGRLYYRDTWRFVNAFIIIIYYSLSPRDTINKQNGLAFGAWRNATKSSETGTNIPGQDASCRRLWWRWLSTEVQFRQEHILLLVDEFGGELEYDCAHMRGLSPLMQVMVALRIYAASAFQQDVADTFCVSKPTVCRTVHRVATVLARRIHQYVQFERPADVDRTKAKFFWLRPSRMRLCALTAHMFQSLGHPWTSMNSLTEKEFTPSTCLATDRVSEDAAVPDLSVCHSCRASG